MCTSFEGSLGKKRDDFYLSGYSVSSPALVTVISLSSDSSEPSCGQLNTNKCYGFISTKSFPKIW